MPTNQTTLFRQWHMLRRIPRYPQKVTVQSIRDHLRGEGIEVTERTLQRDLNELSRLFPLASDEREKPFGWSWRKDAKSFDLPGLSVAEALTWVMAEQHLAPILPVSMMELLQPCFRSAHERLDNEPTPHRGQSWLNKVRTVPPTQPLIAPEISPDVQRLISEALLHEQQIEVQYRRKNESTPTRYQIHPLALIQRGSILYLYARFADYDNARSLAVHRIESVQRLDTPATPPEGFDLDTKIAEGVWGFGGEQSLSLVLRFYDKKGEHLRETPLSKDQDIQAENEATLIVKATVPDTPQLHWWLLGFGDGVEVVAPESLRHDLSETCQRMAARYALLPDANAI